MCIYQADKQQKYEAQVLNHCTILGFLICKHFRITKQGYFLHQPPSNMLFLLLIHLHSWQGYKKSYDLNPSIFFFFFGIRYKERGEAAYSQESLGFLKQS